MLLEVFGEYNRQYEDFDNNLRRAVISLHLITRIHHRKTGYKPGIYKHMATPALYIDRKLAYAGKVPSVKEFTEKLKNT